VEATEGWGSADDRTSFLQGSSVCVLRTAVGWGWCRMTVEVQGWCEVAVWLHMTDSACHLLELSGCSHNSHPLATRFPWQGEGTCPTRGITCVTGEAEVAPSRYTMGEHAAAQPVDVDWRV
jgi:hypothetical protein